MSSDPDTSALQRFARDLRRIRKDREVSLSTVHSATQVPESQLHSFEEGTLYEKSSLTPVYLRGFVRAYAQAIGISPDSVLNHLDSALSGDYDNQLAAEHLEVPPSVTETESSVDPPDSPNEGKAPDPQPSPGGEEEAAEEDEDAAEGATEGDGREEETTSPVSPAGAQSSEFSSSRTGSVPSRESASRKQGVAASGGWLSMRAEHRSRLLVAAIGLVLLIAAGVLVSSYLGTGAARSDSSAPPSPSATASASRSSPDSGPASDTSRRTPPASRPPLADVTLGDTLYVTVVARGDVRGMRVQQDDDLRRPYWIRDGRAKVFPFTQQITVQDQLDSLRLLLEQYSYPASRTDDQGRIVITRDTAQQFFDSLRATPSTVPAPPDTVWGKEPGSDASLRPGTSPSRIQTGTDPRAPTSF
jgi:hypothetical protein